MTAAPFDYADMVATADELLQEFGRQVSFIKTSSTPTDSTKPWRGENTAAATKLDNVWAALVPYTADDDKDSVRFKIQMVIVSASAFPSNDGETFNQMVDADGGLYYLHDADVVAPGGTRILYTFRATQ